MCSRMCFIASRRENFVKRKTSAVGCGNYCFEILQYKGACSVLSIAVLISTAAMNLLGLAVLVCVTIPHQLLAQFSDNKNDESGRVFRGRFANSQEFPWMVHLQIAKKDNKVSVCGGSIISKDHVLTAAHCVCSNATTKTYADATAITGRIGHINRADATRVAFSKVIVHENYDEDYNADIAILKLKNSLTKFDKNIDIICLADNGKKFPNKQPVVQMGWGRFDNGSVITSPTLKTTALGYLLDNPSCIKEMQSYADPGQLCVSNLKGEKICGGDSGGPLVVVNGADKLDIGIVSYDYYDWCVEDNSFPAFYTEVSFYANWIKKKTSDKGICWKK